MLKRLAGKLYHGVWRRALAVALRDERTRRAIISGAFREEHFETWEQMGYHVTPVSPYSPIPEFTRLPATLWGRESRLPGVDMREDAQLALLETFRYEYQDEYNRLAIKPNGNPYAYYADNIMFNEADAPALWSMVRHVRPRRIIEVGSGFSTRITAAAVMRNGGSAELTCIEPDPQRIPDGLPGLSGLLIKPVQDVPLEVFAQLGENDILFIDSSHVMRIGNDLHYLLLDVVPSLNPGVLVHFHDQFFPHEYRRDWVTENHWAWNEQYALQAFLAFNSAFEVLWASHYLYTRHEAAMRDAFPNAYPTASGGSVWLRRRTAE